MQSLTVRQPPSQPSTKRRKLVPTVDPEVFETLTRLSDILEDIPGGLSPFVPSHVARRLMLLSPTIQQLSQELALMQKTAGVHYAADSESFFEDRFRILQVRDHFWELQDIDESATLSADVDGLIRRLKHSDCDEIGYSESSIRVIVELVILDRLHHFSDKEVLKFLQLYPKTDVDLLLGDTYISGRADWLLCYDDPRYGIHSALLAIETKATEKTGYAESLMAAYLAAMHASRAKIQKTPATAFGITTDGTYYRFWYMDSERQLFSSTILNWHLHQAQIIASIDKVLAEAIKASPLGQTRPENVSVYEWQKSFRQSEILSSRSDNFFLTEGIPFGLAAPDPTRIVGVAWYQRRKVMMVEYDDEDEESNGDDK